MTAPIEVPAAWYNVLADHDIELPRDRQSTIAAGAGPRPARLNVPKSLVRQSLPLQAEVAIPEPVRQAYQQWRPTPLRRAARLEKALGTRARIYIKDESGNVAGSHKYLTALAQAYYYAEAGVHTLITATAAGQWGTAVAAAARHFGLGCRIHMVPGSYDRKPSRRVLMELLGAEVIRSRERPDARPAALREAMSAAITEAAGTDGARWVLGGSEPFAILHSTVIGLEAKQQLAALGETADPVLVGYLGGGKNVGGLGLPFLAGRRGQEPDRLPRIVAVESAWYPVLTSGTFRFDDTDDTGLSPRTASYTLGRGYPGAAIQAEGMRYHAAPPLISALRQRGLVSSVAHQERSVFDSARLLLATEGLLASAEAAYAVHAACQLAREPTSEDRPIVFCLSDHGYHDQDAYRAYLVGGLVEPAPPATEIDCYLPATAGVTGEGGH